MKSYIKVLSRWIVGAVFVFSGFVKGVDPLGTAYKLQDYFEAYGTEWANSLSLFLSIFLSSLEFAIGAALLINLLPKLTARILTIVMVFFTLLTFYDALYAPVPDCGCFGDAIKLTNWQTFYKNLVLMVFVITVLFDKDNQLKKIPQLRHLMVGLLLMGGFAAFSWYNYQHLPMLDFRAWKIGNQMTANEQAEAKVYLTYRNKNTGETKEYLSPDYPWNDTVWLANWEFVDQRFVTDAPLLAHNLRAEDAAGNDFTDFVLQSEMMYVIVAYDLEKISKRGSNHLAQLMNLLRQKGANHLVLTASLPEEAEAWKLKNSFETEVFYADDIVLKTMIRSNPGLVLFHKGKVVNKWHHNDFPDEAAWNKQQLILLNQAVPTP